MRNNHIHRIGSGITRRGPTILGFLILLTLPLSSTATTISSLATSTVGTEVFSALFTIDDGITPGSLVGSIAVQGDDSKIRIRGFATSLVDSLSLAGLSVVGEDVKRALVNLGGNRLGTHPIDPACKTCDLVITFNKPAKGDPDRSVGFTISDTAGPLSLGAFDNQDFAVLLQVKGAYNTRGVEHGFFVRDRKLVVLEGMTSLTPIPEPSTAFMLVLGLVGLSLGERRTRGLRD